MIRILLWILLIIVLWRIIRRLFRSSLRGGTHPMSPRPPFSDIQETDYEDLSKKDQKPPSGSDQPR